jgi:nitrogenase molybdenum-iron protein alpha chain
MIIEKAAPAREERLKAGIAFCGTCAQLQNRLGQKDNGCLYAANRSFSQAHGCQFTLSLGILNSLRNTVIIMHGPVGCGFCSTANIGTNKNFKRLRDPSAGGVVWLSTNLDESDVIAGGEKKLREAVIYADREFRPEAIVVASSCVPALIGDDVDGILDNLEREVAAELVPVNCEGFKTKLMATAYDAVYNGVLKKLTKYRRREARLTDGELADALWEYDKKRTVNVFNVGSMSRADELEIQRLLSALDLKANFLPCFSHPDDFRAALDAALNISVCGTHDDYYLKYIHKEFNIPYVIDTMPIGRKATARWLLKIARHFGMEERARRLIEKEEAELEKAIEEFRAIFKGKRAYVSGGEVRIFVTAEALMDLGVEIAGFKGHHIDEFAWPVMEGLDDIGNTYINIASQHPFEQVNIVKRLNPDFLVIHTGSGNITAKHGLPVLPLFGPGYNYLGYSGVFEIARRLRRVTANSQFNKNMQKYRPTPYREQWYGKDPSAYIKDAAIAKCGADGDGI